MIAQRNLTITILPALACGLFASSLAAAEKPASELELKTERVIVFKDGYSLIIKRGTATADKAGEVYTDDVPDAAVLGSFWAVPDEGRLVSMLAGWKSDKNAIDKEIPCTQTIEILQANVGKQAKIELQDKTLHSGVILEVLADRTETPVPHVVPEAWDNSALSSTASKSAKLAKSRSGATRVETMSTLNGSNFILRGDDGDVLLPIAQVRSVVVKEMTTKIAKTFTTTKKTKRLSFKFEKPEQKQALTIMYFRPGIRWIPTYRVSLSDAKDKNTANLSLQAELLNEAEDLEDVPVDIVVGVPNFRFRDTPSPLVLEAALRNTLAEAVPQLSNGNNSISNAMFSQRVGEFRRPQAVVEVDNAVVNLPGELTAGGAQDLFVYKLPKLSLEKGDRCAVPIFTADVPYRDVYTWDVRITKPDTDAAPSSSGSKSPLALTKNEVWHQVVLTNNTQYPWTTGAAMIMQGQQPLAQELLTYTPSQGEVRVPVTVAIDTRGSLTDQETSRELKSLQWDNVNYARIDKELKLALRNNKRSEIEVEITLHVGGKATKATDDGNVTLAPFDAADWVQYHGHPAVNNSSTVQWRATVKPGETFSPTTLYHYFTRH